MISARAFVEPEGPERYELPVPAQPPIGIRDPIHGTIRLSRSELKLINHPAYQRLRWIKQLGLADFAYPGATHTRFSHGLGTLHVATRMFDSMVRDFTMSPADRARLRQTVRLAALFHDLGHAPLSHTTEQFMPPVAALDLGEWRRGAEDRRASHEDYTLKVLTDSSLAQLIDARLGDEGVRPADVAALISGRASGEVWPAFIVDSLDWGPVLAQCVSSELDADRMDYLLRDSYFAGVPYGRYDLEWLLDQLRAVDQDGRLYLGLESRAAFTFDDYLLSRFHMFVSVYLHHTPVGYELMLDRYRQDPICELRLPADPEAYLHIDDVFLIHTLRTSASPWARRIVERRAFRRVVESRQLQAELPEEDNPLVGPPELTAEAIAEGLKSRGIETLVHTTTGRLSKYTWRTDGPEAEPNVFVLEAGHAIPVADYTPLYRRYAGEIQLRRVYVDPERIDDAFAYAEQVAARFGPLGRGMVRRRGEPQLSLAFPQDRSPQS